MKRTPHSLTMQIAGARHVLAYAQKPDLGISPEIIEAATDALKTLEVIERHQSLTRAAIRLEQKHPEITALMKAFPEAELVGFRYDDATPEAAE